MKANSSMNLKIVGLMCIPAKTNAPEKRFAKMKHFFDTVNFRLNDDLKLSRLSLVMSADYRLAIQYGSTDVRVCSSL
ncbi:YggS family pyridoxal phosphate-dependent enzyme, partial [Francisella tularensis subsp. holarctica]|nr:YggS family pyridoxal phosphate-dependent enzyme [Francisella tularensis subsp. holarctica]